MFRVGVGIRVTACHSSGLGLCFGLRSKLGLRLGFRCRERGRHWVRVRVI